MSEHLADVFGQGSYGVRLEWGAAGAATLAPGCTALVIVDVLSFTTSASRPSAGRGLSLPVA
ncbi:MAG TPA: hypothetical protein VFV41_02855 [Streptosporangiaceae bacterium]|nr:hypothetical protein [Streptosporangiaceae bacterium]